MITAKQAQELMKLNGTVRGVAFRIDYDNINALFGKDKVKIVEDYIKKLGIEVNYESFRNTALYPVGLRFISLIAIKDVFKLTDNDIKKMGFNAPRVSFIVKLFTRAFLSVDALLTRANIIWKKHFNGSLKVIKYSKQKKFITAQLEGFVSHKIFCVYLGGYFESIVSLTLPNNKVTAREILCDNKKGIHRFKLTWK